MRFTSMSFCLCRLVHNLWIDSVSLKSACSPKNNKNLCHLTPKFLVVAATAASHSLLNIFLKRKQRRNVLITTLFRFVLSLISK